MKNILLRTWLGTLLSFLGIFSPVATATLPEPALMQSMARTARVSAVKPAIKPTQVKEITGMNLHANERTYSYVFTGKALQNGQPSVNAQLTVRLLSEDTTLIREVTTSEDGSYSLTLPVTGEPSETIRWEISALTPDMKKAHAVGHQILMEETTIPLNTLLSIY